MSVHPLLTGTAPAATHISVAADGVAGSGRAGATVFALLGLASLVIGALALARTAGRLRGGNARTGALVALTAGPVSLVLGALHLAQTTGGFGNGQGRAGAVVGLLFAGTGTALGTLALARTRRTAAVPTP
ncbi:DUF6223 family protein [Streptomyces broussonetiae]|uniref:DUF6223 family protein n=1 Tax=Streptomyces broussonetiae TaxID=2686304 RepID=A0ABV5EHS0_9ACTN